MNKKAFPLIVYYKKKKKKKQTKKLNNYHWLIAGFLMYIYFLSTYLILTYLFMEQINVFLYISNKKQKHAHACTYLTGNKHVLVITCFCNSSKFEFCFGCSKFQLNNPIQQSSQKMNPSLNVYWLTNQTSSVCSKMTGQ